MLNYARVRHYINGTRVGRSMSLDPKVKAVVFDMDRTLLDTVVNFRKLMQIVGEEYMAGGVPQEVIAEDAKIMSTMNSAAWLKANLTPAQIAEINERIETRSIAVELETVDQAKPFPGAKEFVEKLIATGYKVAILTRGSKGYVKQCLEMCGMTDLFKVIIDREDTTPEERKPHPKAMGYVSERIGVPCANILYIGDEPVDFKTATSAGTMFVGVETGPLDRAKWEAVAGKDVVTYPSITEFAKEL